jgi:hypothetical protein
VLDSQAEAYATWPTPHRLAGHTACAGSAGSAAFTAA